MTTGLAAVVRSVGAAYSLEQVEMPALAAHQVLVRLEAVGICHADIGAQAGHFPVSYPVVLGHEGCGIAVEVGSAVTHVAPGQRVVLTFDTCGQCPDCLADRPARCSNQLTRNWIGDAATPRAGGGSGEVQLGFFGQSSFAQYAVSGTRNTIPIDTPVKPELLAPLGCGIQTGFGAVSNMLSPSPGDRVAVFGAGGVGLSAVMALNQVDDVTIVVVDPDPARRTLAQELGAALVLDPAEGDVSEAIRARWPEGLTGAVECSGNSSAFRAAVSSVGQSGRVVLVGSPPTGTLSELDVFDVVLGSKTIMGCIEGDGDPFEMIPHLTRLIEAGQLPLDRLITSYSFDDIGDAVEDMAAGRVIKPVLTFS